MLVYGDQREQVAPQAQLALIAERLRDAHAPGLSGHAALVAALIETGRLLQGIADAVFAAAKRDCRTPMTQQLSELLLEIGTAVVRSSDSDSADRGRLPALPRFEDLPPTVELTVPEGYAFYTLYPEAYIHAARQLKLAAVPRVIGIRSIGTSLSAVVAAAIGAPTPVTVRPFGDPFRREIAIAPDLAREMLADGADYIVVDEGPGQSGSSFGAVADWLVERGVPLERVAFLPSHAGPLGPQASAAHRDRWQQAQVVAADFGERLRPLVRSWVEEVTGKLDGPLEDLSGGKWRHCVYSGKEDWPAAQTLWERRKFMVRAGNRRFLIKFAGLGAAGERKLSMARALHAAGLTPEPVGLAHGFLVERWCDEARALAASDKPTTEVARYIGTRARLFPAAPGSGGSLELLHEMAVRNTSLSIGPEAAAALSAWRDRLDALARRVIRVRTDNKLDRPEWLRTTDGRLLKTDALDHHCGHDLIGCQDLAWDVAGAICELDLSGEQLIPLTEQAAGRVIDRELLAFYRVAYAAFRLGQAAMARGAVDPEEAVRLSRAEARYVAELQQLLPCSSAATRQESWVG